MNVKLIHQGIGASEISVSLSIMNYKLQAMCIDTLVYVYHYTTGHLKRTKGVFEMQRAASSHPNHYYLKLLTASRHEPPFRQGAL